jgi:chemotaxis signal transduction protein
MQTLTTTDGSNDTLLSMEPALQTDPAPQLDVAPAPDVWFGYRIGCHHFVLDKALLSELVVKPDIYPLPKSPSWLCGVINLRGKILSVVDLSESLSTVCKSAPGEYVLVIDKGNDALALLVDGPPHSLPEPSPSTTPRAGYSLQSDFIEAGVQAENQLWMQLDIKGLVKHLQAGT